MRIKKGFTGEGQVYLFFKVTMQRPLTKSTLCSTLQSIFGSANLHFVNQPSIPPSFDFMFLRLNNCESIFPNFHETLKRNICQSRRLYVI